MVVQYVFLVLAHATSWETLREMDVKNFQCYYKQQITNSFPWSIYTFIDHRNDIKMFKTTVKPHAYDLWFHFHCLPVCDTHKNQATWSGGGGRGGRGVMGYQYTWFLLPEIPLCQTTKNLYLSSYAKCSIPEILEIKWCILTGKRYLRYCTSIPQTSGQPW